MNTPSEELRRLAFFWPGFVIGFWAIGLVMHAWAAFVSRPITDADVQREVERLQRRSA